MINSQSPMSCTCINPYFKIKKGHEFLFKIDGVTKFSGIVTDVEMEEIAPTVLHYNLEINDWTWLTNKRLVGQVFENKTAKYIIEWIIDNILVDEGISKGTIQTGLTFDKVVFNYKSATECFNYIQEACVGYNWIIDVDKNVHFVSKTTYVCNTMIDDSFFLKNFRYRDPFDGYVNTIYGSFGRKKTTLQSDYVATPKPDGSSKEFSVRYPIANKPVVYIDSTEQTVGINGLDSGKDCYWSYQSDKITFETAPTGTAIKVTYYGLVEIKMLVQDTIKIDERKLIEVGTSGKYEQVYQNKDVESNLSAVQYSQGIIDKYNDQSTIEFDVEYDIADLEVNKLIKVEKSLFGIDRWYLIESISASSLNNNSIKYHVKLIGGEHVGNWTDYFKKLLPKETEINADDKLIQYRNLSEQWEYKSTTFITQCTPLYMSNSTYMSNNTKMGVGTRRNATGEKLYMSNNLYMSDNTIMGSNDKEVINE